MKIKNKSKQLFLVQAKQNRMKMFMQPLLGNMIVRDTKLKLLSTMIHMIPQRKLVDAHHISFIHDSKMSIWNNKPN